jgi:hypothetical protein
MLHQPFCPADASLFAPARVFMLQKVGVALWAPVVGSLSLRFAYTLKL